MSRPLRIEFPGAVYHVTSRGDRRESIYRDDEDRRAQLRVIAQAMERFDGLRGQVLPFSPRRDPALHQGTRVRSSV